MTVKELICYLCNFDRHDEVVVIDDAGYKQKIDKISLGKPVLKTVGMMNCPVSSGCTFERNDKVVATGGRNKGEKGVVLSTTKEGYICVLFDEVGIDYISPGYITKNVYD